jgi:hypothetical protein
MYVIRVRLVRIQGDNGSFSRGGAYSDKTRLFLRPVKGGIVWKLVADAYLPVVDLAPTETVHLAESQPVARYVDDQEPGVVLCRMW